MIVVDTSALMAIVLGEPQCEACIAALEAEEMVLISAGTAAETLIVGSMRNVGEEVAALIEGLAFEVVPVTHASAREVARTYAKWGRGAHPAGLNFGDCFAYELAVRRQCGLLYVGDDFARADVMSVL